MTLTQKGTLRGIKADTGSCAMGQRDAAQKSASKDQRETLHSYHQQNSTRCMPNSSTVATSYYHPVQSLLKPDISVRKLYPWVLLGL